MEEEVHHSPDKEDLSFGGQDWTLLTLSDPELPQCLLLNSKPDCSNFFPQRLPTRRTCKPHNSLQRMGPSVNATILRNIIRVHFPWLQGVSR